MDVKPGCVWPADRAARGASHQRPLARDRGQIPAVHTAPPVIGSDVDIHDMEGAQAMLAAPPADVVELMESHGVVQPITVYIER